MTASSHYQICPFCEATCGLKLTVEDGKVTRVEGEKRDPFSRGYICPKGVAIRDLHNDPDRLRTPLIKKNGTHVEASWEEAFEHIAAHLPQLRDRGGPDAIGLYFGNPVAHKAGLALYTKPLAKAIGTKNIFSASTVDQIPRHLTSGLMYGNFMTIPVPDIERSDLILMLGANPLVSNGSMWTVPDFRGRLKEMQARGGKLIVIDPRRTETAKAADEHYFIKPARDAFFLAGLIHTLFADDLVDLLALAPHINGVSEVQLALQNFSAAQVSEICGVPEVDIKEMARELATTERSCVYARIGTCTTPYGTLAQWLVDVLNVLTDGLDREGGAMFPKGPAFAQNSKGEGSIGRGVQTGRWASRIRSAPEVMGELPCACLPEEILETGNGQIRGLITIAGNPALSNPDSARVTKALGSLEFMVSLDLYLNETTAHADVILPGQSPLEVGHYDIVFPQLSCRNVVRSSRPVFQAENGVPEWQIMANLAAIMTGQDWRMTEATAPDDIYAAALKKGPYSADLDEILEDFERCDLGPLTPRMPDILRTPSGKIELAPPMLVTDLDRLHEALTHRDSKTLYLIGRRQVRDNNSWMHNLPVLAKGPERCKVFMHPNDALNRNIGEGSQVLLTSSTGSVQVEAEISEDMMEGVVSLPHGWGHNHKGTQTGRASERPGVSFNILVGGGEIDPLSGNATLTGIEVSIAAAG